MYNARKIILVTGAPRSGTTPVGWALALDKSAHMIYEPLGPTGDLRFTQHLPMPGESSLSEVQFKCFLSDLAKLHLDLKKQWRPSYASFPLTKRMLRCIIGSRTRVSLVQARLRPRHSTLLWKDPHAIFTIQSCIRNNIPTVVCMRPPQAHAASYKRLAWIAPVHDIYVRYRSIYGKIDLLDEVFVKLGVNGLTPLQSGALLWHLIYTHVLRVNKIAEKKSKLIHIISSKELEEDEMALYQRLYGLLGMQFQGHPEKTLKRRVHHASNRAAKEGAVHDWTRTIASTNASWKTTLATSERDYVEEINMRLYERLCNI